MKQLLYTSPPPPSQTLAVRMNLWSVLGFLSKLMSSFKKIISILKIKLHLPAVILISFFDHNINPLGIDAKEESPLDTCTLSWL